MLSDDKNEKYNRTYQFSTAQILTFFMLTCVLLFTSGSSWSSARSAEDIVRTQSLALRQMQAEIGKITELRREGGLTQAQGDHKWNKVVKTVMRSQTRAHDAKVGEKAAQLSLKEATAKYKSSPGEEAHKSLLTAQDRVAVADKTAKFTESVAKKAEGLLKAKTDEQGALKSVAEAEKSKTEDPAGMAKAVDALAHARIRAKMFSVRLTEAQTKRWKDKANREIKKVEFSSVASETAEDKVIEVEQKEEKAEIELDHAEAEGVGRKQAQQKLTQITEIADAASSAHEAAVAKVTAGSSAAGAVSKVQGLLSQLADTQKANLAAPGSKGEKLVEQLKEQISEAKTEAHSAVIMRLQHSLQASKEKTTLLKLERNKTMVRLVDANVIARQAGEAHQAMKLKEPLDEPAVAAAKLAAQEAVNKVQEAGKQMKKVQGQLKVEHKHIMDLHRRANHRQADAEDRHTKDESESESEAEINRKFPRKVGGKGKDAGKGKGAKGAKGAKGPIPVSNRKTGATGPL